MPERYAYAEAKTVLNCSRRRNSLIQWTGPPVGKMTAYVLICGWSCKTTFNNERWTLMPPL
jgi:hypothetical protein